MPALTVYTETDITPTALDVFRAAKKKVLGKESLDLNIIGPGAEVGDDPVLGLGTSVGDVRTLSVAQMETMPTAITDLAVAIDLALRKASPPPYEWTLLDKSTIHWLDNLANVVMFDIEVAGDVRTDLPWETPIISMAFYDGQRLYVVPEELCESEDALVRGTITKVLGSRILVGHNGTFDARTVNHRLGTRLKIGHDTLLMYYTCNHGAKSKDLKSLAHRLFNAPDWEKGIGKYLKGGAHYEGIPRPILYEYNAGDVYYTGMLYNHMREVLENDPPRRDLYSRLLDYQHMIQDIEEHGVGVDPVYFDRLDAELSDEIAEHLSALRTLVGDDNFNPGSWQQVQKYLKSQGINVPSTSEPDLEVALRDLNVDTDAAKFIAELLKYRGVNKLHSTYVVGLRKRTRNNVLYPQFLVHGTTTGRLSSKSPNIQNIPRGKQIRGGLVVKKPCNILVQCDYSQAELRTIAEISNDEGLLAAFAPDAKDFFDVLMPAAYPDKFADIEAFLKFKTENAAEAKDLRAKVKGIIYGNNYGRGVPAIARALDMPVEEAQQIVDNYYAAYPGLKEWQENVKAAVVDPALTHYLTTPFNRVFQNEVVTARNKNAVQNAALAFPPQSTANDICMSAALEVHKRCGQYGYAIVALIHDAIVLEGPPERAEEVSKMVQREMEGAAAKVFRRVAFDTDATTGTSWADL